MVSNELSIFFFCNFLFTKVKTEKNKLIIKSIIYLMHHDLSCNINCPVADKASSKSTKHRLLSFKELPSVVCYWFCCEYSELATVFSVTIYDRTLTG